MQVFFILYDAILCLIDWLHTQIFLRPHRLNLKGKRNGLTIRLPRKNGSKKPTIELMRQTKTEIFCEHSERSQHMTKRLTYMAILPENFELGYEERKTAQTMGF